ncbi:MAG: HAD-IA family hydrolase [Chloroflexi bacterium]|nr:HAD-IA family hydrolase [Chloroflexota bacterium]
MTLTLLLDLDDTLLFNSMESFVPAYLNALSTHLKDLVDPRRMSQALLSATNLMAANTRLDYTLKQVFDEAFYPSIGYEEKQLSETLVDFYSRVFPTLQKYTSPNPSAINMVKQAFERGYRIAIATNPLFPLSAIIERLNWAGLPADNFPFALIPSYETFHFSKPNPAYFAEFLAQLGWQEDPVLMVGNDFHNDIEPARSLGICAVWIKNNSSNDINNSSATASLNNIGDLISWLDSTPEEMLKPDFSSPSAYLAILRSTPAALQTNCNRVNKTLWNKRIQPTEWSITEVLCHLRDVDIEVNLPRIQAVVSENNPFLPGMDTDPWAEQRRYINQDCDQAMSSFIQVRSKIVDYLEKIDTSSWQRSARHAIFGPTRLIELVDIIAGHDRLHVQQIQKNINFHRNNK